MHADRLLNVAKALRESPSPDDFTMKAEVNVCGTPACAWGHYFFRTDLQSDFEPIRLGDGRVSSYALHKATGEECTFCSVPTLDHFGITIDQAHELFSITGCNDAETPTEAAEYIERFVARHTEASQS